MNAEEIINVDEHIAAMPLTHGAFQAWRKDEFVPHMNVEEANEDRIIKIEHTLSSWVLIITIIGGLITSLGGYIWYEKTGEIKHLQEIAITNQKAIERIGATQVGVLQALQDQRVADRDQMTLLMKIVDKRMK
jgi:hypothetical protein